MGYEIQLSWYLSKPQWQGSPGSNLSKFSGVAFCQKKKKRFQFSGEYSKSEVLGIHHKNEGHFFRSGKLEFPTVMIAIFLLRKAP